MEGVLVLQARNSQFKEAPGCPGPWNQVAGGSRNYTPTLPFLWVTRENPVNMTESWEGERSQDVGVCATSLL